MRQAVCEVSLTKPSMSRPPRCLLSTRSVPPAAHAETSAKASMFQLQHGRRPHGQHTGAQHHPDQRETADPTGALTALMHTYHTIRRRNMLMYWLRSEYRWVRAVSYLEVFIILTILRRWVFPERFGVGFV